jgi:hypothetical protein
MLNKKLTCWADPRSDNNNEHIEISSQLQQSSLNLDNNTNNNNYHNKKQTNFGSPNYKPNFSTLSKKDNNNNNNIHLYQFL